MPTTDEMNRAINVLITIGRELPPVAASLQTINNLKTINNLNLDINYNDNSLLKNSDEMLKNMLERLTDIQPVMKAMASVPGKTQQLLLFAKIIQAVSSLSKDTIKIKLQVHSNAIQKIRKGLVDDNNRKATEYLKTAVSIANSFGGSENAVYANVGLISILSEVVSVLDVKTKSLKTSLVSFSTASQLSVLANEIVKHIPKDTDIIRDLEGKLKNIDDNLVQIGIDTDSIIKEAAVRELQNEMQAMLNKFSDISNKVEECLLSVNNELAKGTPDSIKKSEELIFAAQKEAIHAKKLTSEIAKKITEITSDVDIQEKYIEEAGKYSNDIRVRVQAAQLIVDQKNQEQIAQSKETLHTVKKAPPPPDIGKAEGSVTPDQQAPVNDSSKIVNEALSTQAPSNVVKENSSQPINPVRTIKQQHTPERQLELDQARRKRKDRDKILGEKISKKRGEVEILANEQLFNADLVESIQWLKDELKIAVELPDMDKSISRLSRLLYGDALDILRSSTSERDKRKAQLSDIEPLNDNITQVMQVMKTWNDKLDYLVQIKKGFESSAKSLEKALETNLNNINDEKNIAKNDPSNNYQRVVEKYAQLADSCKGYAKNAHKSSKSLYKNIQIQCKTEIKNIKTEKKTAWKKLHAEIEGLEKKAKAAEKIGEYAEAKGVYQEAKDLTNKLIGISNDIVAIYKITDSHASLFFNKLFNVDSSASPAVTDYTDKSSAAFNKLTKFDNLMAQCDADIRLSMNALEKATLQESIINEKITTQIEGDQPSIQIIEPKVNLNYDEMLKSLSDMKGLLSTTNPKVIAALEEAKFASFSEPEEELKQILIAEKNVEDKLANLDMGNKNYSKWSDLKESLSAMKEELEARLKTEFSPPLPPSSIPVPPVTEVHKQINPFLKSEDLLKELSSLVAKADHTRSKNAKEVLSCIEDIRRNLGNDYAITNLNTISEIALHKSHQSKEPNEWSAIVEGIAQYRAQYFAELLVPPIELPKIINSATAGQSSEPPIISNSATAVEPPAELSFAEKILQGSIQSAIKNEHIRKNEENPAIKSMLIGKPGGDSRGIPLILQEKMSVKKHSDTEVSIEFDVSSVKKYISEIEDKLDNLNPTDDAQKKAVDNFKATFFDPLKMVVDGRNEKEKKPDIGKLIKLESHFNKLQHTVKPAMAQCAYKGFTAETNIKKSLELDNNIIKFSANKMN
jgi:hypothetical protein